VCRVGVIVGSTCLVCDCFRVVWLSGFLCVEQHLRCSSATCSSQSQVQVQTAVERMLVLFLGNGAKSLYDGTVMLSDEELSPLLAI
jgi:hypothetical protein